MNWVEVCRPLYDGGLGIRKPRLMNTAFFMKLGFSLLANRNSLWAQVVRGKYHCNDFSQAIIRPGRPISKLWRELVQV